MLDKLRREIAKIEAQITEGVCPYRSREIQRDELNRLETQLATAERAALDELRKEAGK